MSEELVPVLSAIENSIVQSHYIKILSKALEASEQSILDAIGKEQKEKKQGYKAKESVPTKQQSRIDRLEVYILALLIQGKTQDQFEELVEHIQIDDVANLSVRSILKRLQASINHNRIFLVKDFADQLPAELTSVFDVAFLWDISDIADDDELMSREWQKALTEYRRVLTRKKIQDLSFSRKEDKPNASDDEALTALTNELKDLDKTR